MRPLLAFFTRIPARGELEEARKDIWMLPLLAPITTAPAAVILYFQPPFANVLAVLALYLTIGLLHLDGLADFADGVMVKGDRERKIKAMKDVNTGIAGLFAAVMVLLIQAETLSVLPFYALYLAELNSKFAMLLALATRRPLGQGLGRFFMEGMDGERLLLGTFLYALLLAPAVIYDSRALLVVVGLLVGAYTIKLALDNFGGLNGDCIGAVAEVTRAGTLLTLAVGLC
ncbi:adenosylcobinamide-GDP ribazoletransferase [Pyrococcus yayanosii]|uniref:Adenosylcobinamide-GDP ribazoletransferase n=1 Tax=Pyrococcus yayanosii (strain CH1 / JCM 16557) TaxID=529709 RepID=F8AHN0_PYRYC|nr:adenosylcobinamide-GDP ribazoletransferase [Pyrococcus yayanosii]AEH25403.1 Cobalamin (5'-phosphate) synthase (cobS) [Pyrococcus yayanosii CH1]